MKEEQLAKIYESYETVGTVLPEIAKELGISENVRTFSHQIRKEINMILSQLRNFFLLRAVITRPDNIVHPPFIAGLNLKVDVIESEEGPAMGGAMLAAVACGEYTNVEEAAAKIVKVVDTVEPTYPLSYR